MTPRRINVSSSQSTGSTCLHSHPTCRKKSTSLPTRIISIAGEASSLQPKQPIDSMGATASFPALSHRWGAGMLKLTARPYDALKESVPWSDFSKNFRYAISVCINLGISYLLIDCLCILQDNSQDWSSESARMGVPFRRIFCLVNHTKSMYMMPGTKRLCITTRTGFSLMSWMRYRR